MPFQMGALEAMPFRMGAWEVGLILFVLIVIGGIGYVIFHFVRKHWG